MKAITRIFSVVILLFIMASTTFAQKTIKGIIYNNGEPAGGILVSAHKTNDTFYTSFDGMYEIKITDKTKWIRFTFLDDTKKVDIDENTGEVLNFSWDGSPIPSSDDEAGVILKSFEELINNDTEFGNNWSLYREFLKQNDVNSALPPWKILYKTYPKSTQNIYIDGIKIMEAKIKEVMMTEKKLQYLDTMMAIYDKRIKYFDNVGEINGLKATKLLEYVVNMKEELSDDEYLNNLKKGNEFAKKSVDLLGEQTQAAVLITFMHSSKILFSADEMDKSVLFENYEKTMNILEKQLVNEDKDIKSNAEVAMPYIEGFIESSGALDCKGLVEFYQPKFNQDSGNVDLIKKILRMMKRENCDDDFSVMLSEKLYELEPSAEAAYNMARTFLKKEDYDKAFEYYKKAYTEETDNVKKSNYYTEVAGLSLQLGKNQEARNFAKEAIKANPDNCNAYMILGEIYAQASKNYSEDEFKRSTVFWLVVDYYIKAAKYDECKETAKNKIEYWSNYFPGTEDIFFNSLQEGDKYPLEGWINETTTVRAKK